MSTSFSFSSFSAWKLYRSFEGARGAEDFKPNAERGPDAVPALKGLANDEDVVGDVLRLRSRLSGGSTTSAGKVYDDG